MTGLDGKIFHSRSWCLDWVQIGPCKITESQICSRLSQGALGRSKNVPHLGMKASFWHRACRNIFSKKPTKFQAPRMQSSKVPTACFFSLSSPRALYISLSPIFPIPYYPKKPLRRREYRQLKTGVLESDPHPQMRKIFGTSHSIPGGTQIYYWWGGVNETKFLGPQKSPIDPLERTCNRKKSLCTLHKNQVKKSRECKIVYASTFIHSSYHTSVNPPKKSLPKSFYPLQNIKSARKFLTQKSPQTWVPLRVFHVHPTQKTCQGLSPANTKHCLDHMLVITHTVPLFTQE